jgi:hypothetical protein
VLSCVSRKRDTARSLPTNLVHKGAALLTRPQSVRPKPYPSLAEPPPTPTPKTAGPSRSPLDHPVWIRMQIARINRAPGTQNFSRTTAKFEYPPRRAAATGFLARRATGAPGGFDGFSGRDKMAAGPQLQKARPRGR